MYCRSLHITSFRSQKPYPMRACERKSDRCGPRRAARQAAGGACRPGRSLAEDLQGPIEDRVGARRDGRSGIVDGDVGLDADVVDPALVRRQPPRDRQAERAALAGQLLPLLDRALAERGLRRRASPGRVSWSAPATISLADALPPSIRQTTLIDGSVAAPPASASVGTWSPSASCSQNIGPSR